MKQRQRRAGAEPDAARAQENAPAPELEYERAPGGERPPAIGRDHPLTLADLRPGESACIQAVAGPPAIQERLRDLGFVEGERVRMVKTAPLADPAEYCVQGIDVGLRRREAEFIALRDATGCEGGHRRRGRHRWFHGRRGEDDP